MPSYNQGEYLEEAILSVLNQDYPDLEFIVMDGGSDDGSIDILMKYSDKFSYWQSKPDNGQADALAQGFERSTGEIQCWLNSDDLLLPGTLQRIGRIFSNNERIQLLYGNRIVVDRDTRVLRYHVWPRYLTRLHWYDGQPLAQECAFWRSSLYRKVGGINRDLEFIMDYDLFFRMWMQTRFHKVNRLLGALRTHDQAKHVRIASIQLAEREAARRRFELREPGYLAQRWRKYSDMVQVKLDRYLMRL